MSGAPHGHGRTDPHEEAAPATRSLSAVFPPCIDLHEGRVKQTVGSTLRDGAGPPATNFVAEHDAAWFASRVDEG